MFIKFLFFAAIILVVFITEVSAFKVLFFSDLHLDPGYGTANAGRGPCKSAPTSTQLLGHYGCDSPLSLINSSVKSAASQNADLTLISGDWLRHDADELSYDGLKNIVSKITDVLSMHLGKNRTNSTVLTMKPPVFDAAGNNDFVPDYKVDLSQKNKMMLTDISNQLRDKYFLTSDEASLFGQCGFFKRTITIGSKNKLLDIIVLNTLLWDVELTPTPANKTDPCGQFEFLENAIRSTTNPIILMSHIPPAVDLHDAVNQLESGTKTPDQITVYWFENFADRFRNLVKANKDRFKLLVFGHTHHVAVVNDLELQVNVLITGAISPVYFNAPNFLTMEFDDETLEPNLTSLTQISLQGQLFADSPSTYWSQSSPSFSKAFDLPQLSLSSSSSSSSSYSSNCMNRLALDSFYNRMSRNESLALTYYKYSAAYGRPRTECSSVACQRLTSCYVQYMTAKETIQCYKNYTANNGFSSSGKNETNTQMMNECLRKKNSNGNKPAVVNTQSIAALVGGVIGVFGVLTVVFFLKKNYGGGGHNHHHQRHNTKYAVEVPDGEQLTDA